MKQKKTLTLRQNFSWTFVGNFVYAACQWGILMVIAKLGSPEMLGQFTLGLAVTAPVMMFTNLQLRSVQVTDIRHRYLFSDYLGLRIISTGFALILITIIIFLAGYHSQTSLVILLVGLAKAFESISDVFYGLIQQHEYMNRIAISLIFKGSLSLLLLSMGVYLSNNILWGVVGLASAWFVVLVTYDIRSGVSILKLLENQQDTALTLQPRWHLQTLRELVWLCLPLGFVMMLISLNLNIPRYFIQIYLGERQLGIFAATAYLMMASNIVVSALGDSASPRLAKYYEVGNSVAFRALILKLVGIAVLLGGIGVLFALFCGKQILVILYSSEYAEHTNLFICLMIAAGVSYIASFLGYAMTAARYFRIQMPLFASVAIISTIVCLWLLPHLGLLAAAIALIIAAAIQACLSVTVIIHALNKIKQIF